ncbi:hypothetical protein [Levilactobacillus brevis]|uniref:hypothetical protein n=1 Tax=Levilactobacillus brevis TaxID=1580 RepID=UPI000BE863DA|nr:hypothetical protein [Levilactobacillus brevis]
MTLLIDGKEVNKIAIGVDEFMHGNSWQKLELSSSVKGEARIMAIENELFFDGYVNFSGINSTDFINLFTIPKQFSNPSFIEGTNTYLAEAYRTSSGTVPANICELKISGQVISTNWRSIPSTANSNINLFHLKMSFE